MIEAVAPKGKLAPNRRVVWRGTYWHPIKPSTVAGGRAATFPLKSAHCRGYEAGCVAIAAQPDDVAFMMVSTTPGDVCIVNYPTFVVYAEFSKKYASSALDRLRRSDFSAAAFAFPFVL